MERPRFETRLRLISVIFILAGVVFLGRLYQVQIVRAEYYRGLSDRQYVNPTSGVFNRGKILFTDKNGETISAATLEQGVTIAVRPYELENPSNVFNILAPHLPELTLEEFLAKASTSTPGRYREIARRVPEDVGTRIQELEIPGIIVAKESWRFYPGGSTAAHVLGFVGFKGDMLAGRYGIERYYDDVLSRTETGNYGNFFAEIFSTVGTTLARRSFGGEGDVALTIEPTVQDFLEQVIGKTKDTWSAREIGAIVINPKTGAIYAMAATPSFDPNTYNEESDVSVFANPLVEKVYEMGSTVKPLTMAAGIDAGAVTAATTYNDQGFGILNGRRFGNYDGKGRGVVSMQEVLNQSLNTGVAFVAERMGYENFADYFEQFGLREETGIDLPNELRGLTSNLDNGQPISFATASYGQGIAVTPINLVRALSALANGGTLVTPHVTKELIYTIGVSNPISYGEGERVISKETSETITRMLVTVVDDALIGGGAKNERLSVAAKTGTAQVPKPGGGYYDDRFLHSFFGYFPAYDPQFLVFFYILYPVGAQYASQTLTPPFLEMERFLISYYNVLPDR